MVSLTENYPRDLRATPEILAACALAGQRATPQFVLNYEARRIMPYGDADRNSFSPILSALLSGAPYVDGFAALIR